MEQDEGRHNSTSVAMHLKKSARGGCYGLRERPNQKFTELATWVRRGGRRLIRVTQRPRRIKGSRQHTGQINHLYGHIHVQAVHL